MSEELWVASLGIWLGLPLYRRGVGGARVEVIQTAQLVLGLVWESSGTSALLVR